MSEKRKEQTLVIQELADRPRQARTDYAEGKLAGQNSSPLLGMAAKRETPDG
jgi:hypothetical protein